MRELTAAFEAALARRADLVAGWHAEGSDAYRLLHGAAEGAPGVTVDRYGPSLLVQTWREPVDPAVVGALAGAASELVGQALRPVWNHRVRPVDFASWYPLADEGAPVARELGVAYDARLRHRGQDPLLFLDLRSLRRRLLVEARGLRVLNLFAYTCGVGVAAQVGGAASVDDVDFATSALAVGAANHAANPGSAVVRQHPSDVHAFLREAAPAWDLVVLDPPAFARSKHGVVDVVRDYPALFKPALRALAPGGGVVVATHHVASVSAAAFEDTLRRCAAKAGRPLRSVEMFGPEADFPTFDGQPPLKVAWCVVGPDTDAAAGVRGAPPGR